MKKTFEKTVTLEKREGTTFLTLPLVAFVALVFTIAFLLLLIWSIKRRNDVHFKTTDAGNVQDLVSSIAGVTHGTIQGGNSIDVLQNGEFFKRLFVDIAAARETIHFETFLWHEGAVGDRLGNALAAKARQGVEVRVMLDASGTRPMDDELEEMMQKAGCKVVKFHGVNLSNLGRLNNRTHRKLTIIDGRIGYTGGHGIAPEWEGEARHKKEFRDTAVRIEGPVVGQLQAAFSENWIEETGEVTAGEKYFPQLPATGTVKAHLVYSSQAGSASAVELLYYLAIVSARRELIIQNPYFLPDSEGVKEMEKAIKRGVRVVVMMPSAEATDTPLVQHASHYGYAELLRIGVELYEYQKTLLHQKVIIVDGRWACVGSTNFDDRSLEINDEDSLAVLDRGVAETLMQAYQEDLKHSARVDDALWKKRGLLHRARDAASYLISEQL